MLVLRLKQFGRSVLALDIWMLLLGSMISVLSCMVIYMLYLQWEIPHLQKELQIQQEKLQSINLSLSTITKQDQYKKYKNAKLLQKKEKGLDRTMIVPNLINVLQKMQQEQSTQNLVIQDFQINLDKITMRGSMNNLSAMYTSGGILDTFTALPYITSVDVPFYKQYAGSYEFLLEALLAHDTPQSK